MGANLKPALRLLKTSGGIIGGVARKYTKRGEPYAQFRLDGLSALLVDAVTGGASVGFVLPFTVQDARRWWEKKLPEVDTGGIVVLTAWIHRRLVGTVQLCLPGMPNGQHRAEVAKMLVHPDARRQGMERAQPQPVDRLADPYLGGLVLSLRLPTRRRAPSPGAGHDRRPRQAHDVADPASLVRDELANLMQGTVSRLPGRFETFEQSIERIEREGIVFPYYFQDHF